MMRIIVKNRDMTLDMMNYCYIVVFYFINNLMNFYRFIYTGIRLQYQLKSDITTTDYIDRIFGFIYMKYRNMRSIQFIFQQEIFQDQEIYMNHCLNKCIIVTISHTYLLHIQYRYKYYVYDIVISCHNMMIFVFITVRNRIKSKLLSIQCDMSYIKFRFDYVGIQYYMESIYQLMKSTKIIFITIISSCNLLWIITIVREYMGSYILQDV